MNTEEKKNNDVDVVEEQDIDIETAIDHDADMEELTQNDEFYINESEDTTEKKSVFNVKRLIIISICIILLIIAIVGGINIKKHIDDVKAANNVVNMINDIGEISSLTECGTKIGSASQAYDALTEKQKSYVSNIDVLNSAKEEYEIKRADSQMILLAVTLKNNAELCQAFFSDYSGVWYNAIYKKTDKYNNGNFSDFNDALLNFQNSDTYTGGINTLKKMNKTIVSTWSDLKDATVSDSEAYQAVKDLYIAYKPMYDLATNPHGSYNSYTSEVQHLNNSYNSAYAALSIAMPSIDAVD